MEKKIAIVGIGNAGGQVANMAENRYPELFDCIYINSSEADLAMVSERSEYKYKIGDREEIEGSGKNRLKMKQYLKADINKILGVAVRIDFKIAFADLFFGGRLIFRKLFAG